MAYQQQGRLLVPIKTQVVPIGDLGLPIGGVSGLQYPDDLPPVLAINGIQTTAGPRIVHGNPAGSVFARPSAAVTLINGLTYTASTNLALPDLTWVELLAISLSVGAASGTTPTFSIQLQGSPDGGTTYYQLCSVGNATATSNSLLLIAGSGASASTAANFTAAALYSGPVPPLCRLHFSVGGTTPSFTVSAILVTE